MTLQLWKRAGYLAALAYMGFALGSYFHYPQPYSPLRNWLSDLGNTLVNTGGGFVYNFGCIATGCILVFFFVGLNAWRTGDRVSGRLLTIAQAPGVFSSAALILSAAYNIGENPELHSKFSMYLAIGLTWFLSFANTAFLRHPRFRKRVGVYGFLAAAATFSYGVLYNTPIGEWIAIGMFVSYVLALVTVAETTPAPVKLK